jgi:hypothetical protein
LASTNPLKFLSTFRRLFRRFMMQLCSSLLCIVILWWTSSCFGAAVDAPNAERPKNFAAPETAGPDPPSAAATGLAKVKAALEVENENFVGSKTTNTLTTTTDNVNDVFRETKSGEAILSRRLKRSFAPTETLSPANRRYRRSMGSTWKRRPWRPSTNIDDDYLTSQPQSSFPESGSLIYLVSSSSSSDINNNQQNSFQQSDPDKKDCSERKFPSEDSSSPFEDAFSAEEGSPTHVEEPRRQALKRVDRSSTSDMLASAGQNIARNFMKRRRGGRMYDVPQIGESF